MPMGILSMSCFVFLFGSSGKKRGLTELLRTLSALFFLHETGNERREAGVQRGNGRKLRPGARSGTDFRRSERGIIFF